MTDRPSEKVFTVKELATRWSVSSGTISSMIRAGVLCAFVVGVSKRHTTYRIAAAEVERHEAGLADRGMNPEKAQAMLAEAHQAARNRRQRKRSLPPIKYFF